MPRHIRSKVVLKKPRAIEKDLSKDKVWGFADQEDFIIEIEKNQSGKEALNTYLHECFHCMLPDLSEKQVTKMADIISKLLWARRFRRISK